jgi:hypothetical protein
MAGMKSRDKGKRGEREVVTLLRAEGIRNALRTATLQNVSGGVRAADVLAEPLGVEVKRGRAVPLRRSIVDALDGERAAALYEQHLTPVLAHRDDGGRWLATLDLRDLARLLFGREVRNG